MKLQGVFRFTLCMVVVGAGLLSVTLAQTTPTDTVPPITNGLAHENVASPAARSPGDMVSAGVASAQNAVKLVRTSSSTITETADEESDFTDNFISQAKDLIMDQIEELVLYFANLIFERFGLPPIEIPVDNDNNNDNDNTNGNTNDNTNSNTNDNDNTNGNTNDNDNANVNGNDNSNENDNTRPSSGVRKGIPAPQAHPGRK